MITFALDTATAGPSVALTRGTEPIAELWLAPQAGAGRRVLQATHGLLEACDLAVGDIGRIVVGVGPGGFTGLRIGLSTALALGQALRVPVSGCVSLEALALGIARSSPGVTVAVPVIDARRRELFAAAYAVGADGSLDELIPPSAMPAADLVAALSRTGSARGAVVGGPGVAAAGDAFADAGVEVLGPGSTGHRLRAALLAERVEVAGGREVRPVYARLPDAEVNRRAAALSAGG